MLQQEVPEDFVIATGKQYSVRDFVVAAGSLLDMKIEWQGEGVDEVGIDAASGRTLIRVDPRYFRPTEVDTLLGDADEGAGKTRLDGRGQLSRNWWRKWLKSDLELAKRDALVAKEGYKIL